MTEIPEHLLKRAKEAREKSAAAEPAAEEMCIRDLCTTCPGRQTGLPDWMSPGEVGRLQYDKSTCADVHERRRATHIGPSRDHSSIQRFDDDSTGKRKGTTIQMMIAFNWWNPLEGKAVPGINTAFLVSLIATTVLTLVAIPYGKRRPKGTPFSWGEAMRCV